MTSEPLPPPADTPLRRCRTCDVPQPRDVAHFRPLADQRVRPLLLAQRCRACDAAAARGELLTSRERERARRRALADSTFAERPGDEELLRTRRAPRRSPA